MRDLVLDPLHRVFEFDIWLDPEGSERSRRLRIETGMQDGKNLVEKHDFELTGEIYKPIKKTAPVLATVGKLFRDYETKFKVLRNGQDTFLSDGTIVRLGQEHVPGDGSLFLAAFRHRESRSDMVFATVGGQSIMVKRTTEDRVRTHPKRSRSSPQTTVRVDVVPASGSSEQRKTWTINPAGELLVKGQVVNEPEELQEVLRIVRSLKPSTKEHETG
jgi:hypothetical protein